MVLARTRVAVTLEKFPDRQPNAVQASVAKVAATTNASVIPTNAVIVRNLTFASGSGTQVLHGLGYVPQNWIMVAPRSYTSGTVAFVQVISAGDPPLEQVLVLNGQGGFMADVMVW